MLLLHNATCTLILLQPQLCCVSACLRLAYYTLHLNAYNEALHAMIKPSQHYDTFDTTLVSLVSCLYYALCKQFVILCCLCMLICLMDGIFTIHVHQLPPCMYMFSHYFRMLYCMRRVLSKVQVM